MASHNPFDEGQYRPGPGYHDPSHHYPPRPAESHPFWPWLILLILVIGGLIAWRYWPQQESGLNPNATPRPVTPRGSLADEEKTTIKIFRTASPSVVHVTTVAVEGGSLFGSEQLLQGTGSGFIWDQEGHVVTNYHVVQSVVEREQGSAKVILADRSSWDVKWIRAYPEEDLAVLWIDAPKSRLVPIMVGTSHDLQVGQDAFAIGNPYGLDHTLTKGIVSALNREISSVVHTSIKGVIQTDAAINPGNSGGPLLDSAARLIGVNTAILKQSTGIGFAIPVDEVNRIVPQLIKHGKVVHPDMGVQLADDQLMDRLGLEGALILNVTPNSPAARAGLRPTRRTADGRIRLGDVIVAIDGQPVGSKSDYYHILQNYHAGDTVTVTVNREGEREDVKVTLTGEGA